MLNRTVALFLFMNVVNVILLLCTAAGYLTHSSTDADGRYILVMLKKMQYDERITVCSRQLLPPGVIFCVNSYLYKILAVSKFMELYQLSS
jgi:hypothetical protein